MGFDPGSAGADALLGELAGSGARVCLLALGAPKQEIFAARARDVLPDMGFVSVGAGIDFVAGSQVRAPRILRAMALEWLWRLAGSPRRLLGRYAACVAVLPALVQTALADRFGRAPGTGVPE
jgi:exopolysaccharide biosynthesis WecB/TagA/CpsF family protein